MDFATIKVGALARQSGVSIRTLHHYDEIGLLAPSLRTDAGHRLYNRKDLERLHRIRALQGLGLSLEDVAECIDRPEYALVPVLEMQLANLERQIELEVKLKDRLRSVLLRVRESTDDSRGTPEESNLDLLLESLQTMKDIESHYTPEQLETLAQRRDALGESGMAQAQNDWKTLIEEVRSAQERGLPPTDPHVQALAKRWASLIEGFTGGDPAMLESLKNVYRANPDAAQDAGGFGPEPGMSDYIRRAMG